MVAKAKKKADTTISVIEIQKGTIDVCIIGTSPYIYNAMSQKIKRDLLLPPIKKNAAEKASTLKHHPIQEYRDSVYRSLSDDSPTRLLEPTSHFKNSIVGVAIDLPEVVKAPLARNIWVNGTYVHMYGIPQIYMAVVKQAGINGAPDIRTRAILPEWACEISIEYTMPMVREQVVVNLLAAAGMMGVGDYRAQKGKGNFGQYKMVDRNDADYKRIMKAGGMKAQDTALEDPECFDSETQEMLSWFNVESARRGFKVA